jgi:hypothetical protein
LQVNIQKKFCFDFQSLIRIWYTTAISRNIFNSSSAFFLSSLG